MIFVLELSAKNINIYLRLSLLKVSTVIQKSDLLYHVLSTDAKLEYMLIYMLYSLIKTIYQKNIKLRQP